MLGPEDEKLVHPQKQSSIRDKEVIIKHWMAFKANEDSYEATLKCIKEFEKDLREACYREVRKKFDEEDKVFVCDGKTYICNKLFL